MTAMEALSNLYNRRSFSRNYEANEDVDAFVESFPQHLSALSLAESSNILTNIHIQKSRKIIRRHIKQILFVSIGFFVFIYNLSLYNRNIRAHMMHMRRNHQHLITSSNSSIKTRRSNLKSTVSLKKSEYDVGGSIDDVAFPIDAIVTIATGEYSPVRLVTSIYHIGKYTGPTYIYTDNPTNISSSLENEFLENINIVDITKYEPTFETEQEEQTFKSNTEFAPMKWYKTQLFQLLPSHIQTVLFVDADVIVNAPMSYFEWKASDILVNKNKVCAALYFPERWYVPDAMNSGTAIYLRDRSSKLLRLWSKQILSGAYPRDQVALRYALKILEEEDDESSSSAYDSRQSEGEQHLMSACTMPQYLNFYTTDKWVNVLNFISFGQRKKGSTFIHPTAAKDLQDMAVPVEEKN